MSDEDDYVPSGSEDNGLEQDMMSAPTTKSRAAAAKALTDPLDPSQADGGAQQGKQEMAAHGYPAQQYGYDPHHMQQQNYYASHYMGADQMSSPQVQSQQATPKSGKGPTRQRPRLNYHRNTIACSYCRHRKIRCVISSESGRCENCIRQNRECKFLPVGSTEPIHRNTPKPRMSNPNGNHGGQAFMRMGGANPNMPYPQGGNQEEMYSMLRNQQFDQIPPMYHGGEYRGGPGGPGGPFPPGAHPPPYGYNQQDQFRGQGGASGQPPQQQQQGGAYGQGHYPNDYSNFQPQGNFAQNDPSHQFYHLGNTYFQPGDQGNFDRSRQGSLQQGGQQGQTGSTPGQGQQGQAQGQGAGAGQAQSASAHTGNGTEAAGKAEGSGEAAAEPASESKNEGAEETGTPAEGEDTTEN